MRTVRKVESDICAACYEGTADRWREIEMNGYGWGGEKGR